LVRIRTSDIARKLGIDYEVVCEEGSEPEYSSLRFSDLIPELREGGFRSRLIADKRLYKHQEDVIKHLSKGCNIVLRSGTGSGKTEAWVMYALSRGSRVLAIYPTLALSADQVSRIYDYYSSLRLKDKVLKIDRPTIEDLDAISIKGRISDALVIITNPAFLMADLKRLAESPNKSYLKEFLRKVEMIVIDELDFYGSRGASLLIAMAELISKYVSLKKPQIVILTATLGNPEELVSILKEINGRECAIVDGKPFKVRNCTYLILGKNLEEIRKYILNNLREYIDRDLIDLVEDPQKFKRSSLFIIEYLRRKGIKVPEVYFSPHEIIREYVNDDLVTLVFTPSIRVAERLVREIRGSLPSVKQSLIVTHHHLVPKKIRERIEDDARSYPPKIKVIVTVRTLLQGIDIGNVVRIVHYGIPPEVREFLQREGRKGRRKELGETESIVIPYTLWDRSLVSLGIDGIKEYINLPLEKVLIIKDNEYPMLFKSLFKVVAGIELSKEELRLLKKLGLVKHSTSLVSTRLVLSRLGIDVWNKLNFYEYGLPYGIRRLLVKGGRKLSIEPISRRDFVERYQVGSIDVGNEALVTEARKGTITEYSIDDLLRAERRYGFIEEALNAYEEVKIRWGERPNFKYDVLKGKIHSFVDVSVVVPTEGFGLFKEIPMRVRWVIESSKQFRLRRLGDSLMPYYEEEDIELNIVPAGTYQDFTYGFVYELPKVSDLWRLRIGAAMLSLLLRVIPKYSISVRELSIVIDSTPIPPIRLLIWEPEASGVTRVIDWNEVLNDIESLRSKPIKLWVNLLKLIDRDAALEVLMRGIDWNEALDMAEELLRCVTGSSVIKLLNTKLYIPRPSRKLGIMSLEILSISTNDSTVYAIGKYDGEELTVDILRTKGIPDVVIKLMEDTIKYVINKDLKLVTSDIEQIRKLIFTRSLEWLFEKALISGIVINPYELVAKCLGTYSIDLRKVRESLNIKLPEASEVYERVRKGFKGADLLLKKYTENLTKMTYYVYLMHKYLLSKKLCKGD